MTERLTNTIQYVAIVVGGLFFCLLITFLIDDARFDNRMYRNVSIAGIDVSFMTKEEFFAITQTLQENVYNKHALIEYDQEVIEVTPEDVGLHINPEELWNELYEYGHPEDVLDQFFVWIHSFNRHYEGEVNLFADEEVVELSIESWKLFVPDTAPYNGNLSIVGTRAVIDEPQPGSRLDSKRLVELVLDTLINKENGAIIEAPLILIEPERTLQDLTDAQFAVQSLIGFPITLYHDDYEERTLVLGIDDLAQMVRIHFDEDDITQIVINIDDEVLVEKLEPLYPRTASFDINEDEQVRVSPSQDGFDIDVSETAKNILRVTQRANRRAQFVVDAHVVPSFTTEDAEALNIKHLVSRFTTYYSCCQDRVENIHLVADILDGKYLRPNEIMNLNDFLGERTEDRGFKNAGTIIEGKLEESIGGGISQFTTTFHNAVYWGGYNIIAHKPHSIYFSRYPVGIEATINWPYVDYIFQNDTANGLLIKTSYTDESITVSFYGSNDGRQAIGDQKSGVTNIDVTGAGPDARTVISKVSDKYNFHEPLIEYVPDDTLERGTEVIEQVGDPRWSVTVDRIVQEQGEVIRHDTWPVHYRQDNTIIRKHPCDFYTKGYDYRQC